MVDILLGSESLVLDFWVFMMVLCIFGNIIKYLF